MKRILQITTVLASVLFSTTVIFAFPNSDINKQIEEKIIKLKNEKSYKNQRLILGEITKLNKDAMPILLQLVDSEDMDLRMWAFLAILDIKGKDESIIGKAIKDESYETRMRVLIWLQIKGYDKEVEKYQKILADDVDEKIFNRIVSLIREKAKEAKNIIELMQAPFYFEIGYLEIWGKKVVHKLEKIVRDKKENTIFRRRMISFLVTSPSCKTNKEFLFEVANDEQELFEVREEAKNALIYLEKKEQNE